MIREELAADDDIFKVEDDLLPRSKKKAIKVVIGTDIDELSESGKRKRKQKNTQPLRKKRKIRLTLEEILMKDVRIT